MISADGGSGLQAGDVILTLDGTDVRLAHETYRALALASGEVELSIMRRHRLQSLRVTPADAAVAPRVLGFDSLGD